MESLSSILSNATKARYKFSITISLWCYFSAKIVFTKCATDRVRDG